MKSIVIAALALIPIANAATIFRQYYGSTQASSWRIYGEGLAGTEPSSYPCCSWHIVELVFYTDSSCTQEIDVFTEGDIISSDISSDTDAAKAFDKNNNTTWESEDPHPFWIGYKNGPVADVRCIKLVHESMDSNHTMVNLKVQAYKNSEWRDVFKVRDLTVGTNILNLTRACAYSLSNWGNGVCQSWMNTRECDWDGGDCDVARFPGCNVGDPSRIGNGYCDQDFPGYNTRECGWDGGDCVNTYLEILFVVIAGFGIFGVMICIFCICCRSTIPELDMDDGVSNVPQPPRRQSQDPRLEERRTLIFSSITRKVCNTMHYLKKC